MSEYMTASHPDSPEEHIPRVEIKDVPDELADQVDAGEMIAVRCWTFREGCRAEKGRDPQTQRSFLLSSSAVHHLGMASMLPGPTWRRVCL